MKPIGPLMREHRLIEKMLEVVKGQAAAIEQGKTPDRCLVLEIVDFFRSYADRTHHGKEEDILFKQMVDKKISGEHRKLVAELIEEHRQARGIVGRLKEAAEGGELSAKSETVLGCFGEILALYPKHIAKEDDRLFYPCLSYFSDAEQESMLQEFAEFDRMMVHEKYQALVDELG